MPDLRDYVQHKGNCLLGRGIRPVKCPTCGEPMNPVRNHNGYLNSDQFDSVKAGDWFCKRHEAEVVYVWEHDLPKHGCTCGLEAALAAAPASSPCLCCSQMQPCQDGCQCKQPQQGYDYTIRHMAASSPEGDA